MDIVLNFSYEQVSPLFFKSHPSISPYKLQDKINAGSAYYRKYCNVKRSMKKLFQIIVFSEEAIQCNCHLAMQLICLLLRKAFKTHYLAKLYRTAQSIFFSYFKKYKWQLSIKIDKKLINWIHKGKRKLSKL